MAGRPRLLHFHQQRILITVDKNGPDLLRMPRGLPFSPEFFSGSAPEMGLAGLQALLERLQVHIGDHQHFFVFMILDDGRNQIARKSSAVIFRARTYFKLKLSEAIFLCDHGDHAPGIIRSGQGSPF